MSDIVERLKTDIDFLDTLISDNLVRLANNNIQAQAEIERLRAALEEIARPYAADHNRLLHSERQIADIVRAALEPKDG